MPTQRPDINPKQWYSLADVEKFLGVLKADTIKTQHINKNDKHYKNQPQGIDIPLEVELRHSETQKNGPRKKWFMRGTSVIALMNALLDGQK